MSTPFRILYKKRHGETLDADEIARVVAGTLEGGDDAWDGAQLGAFLMAVVIHGLSEEETQALTREMLRSGEIWNLHEEIPGLGDKHSTGGVGDKVSLVLAPILAATGRPISMLTGRGLGHTGGTADKLECIPGVDLAVDRARSIRLLRELGMMIGLPTAAIAPADRRLYALRDVTATVESIPLITASILSKKLASGAAGVVYDVKTGSGAFMSDPADAEALARSLTATSEALGTPARALITDMNQPLGRWAGHAAEVRETLECLEGTPAGEGRADLMELVYVQAEELAEMVGNPVERRELEEAVTSGRARERFGRWAAAMGARSGWEASPEMATAPVEVVLEAPRSGSLAAVDTRELGLLLAEAGGGRIRAGDRIDAGVSLLSTARLGDRLEKGDELARVYLRREAPELAARFAACYEVRDEAVPAPTLIKKRIP